MTLANTRGGRARRIQLALQPAIPRLLVFQVVTLMMTTLVAVGGFLAGGLDYAGSALAWYQLNAMVVGIYAIPAWRRMRLERESQEQRLRSFAWHPFRSPRAF